MRRSFFCIDSHACGNPVRVVAGGGPLLPSVSMAERREIFVREHDWVRTALMFEPRGHDIMSGVRAQITGHNTIFVDDKDPLRHGFQLA